MPLYEYLCPKCRLKVEVLVKDSRAKPPACSRCGGRTKKTISVPGRTPEVPK